MTIKKLNKRESVAEWYVTNVLHLNENHGLVPIIEWFILKLRHNDAVELVEFFGHNESQCHYMVHDLYEMEINMVELPF